MACRGMSEHSDFTSIHPEGHSTPEDVVRLLEVVSDHSVAHALSDIEARLAQLRAHEIQAASARQALAQTAPEVLREALRLRAARIESKP